VDQANETLPGHSWRAPKNKLRILESGQLIRDITHNNVMRFIITELLAEHLSEPALDDLIFDPAVGIWHDPKSNLHVCPRCWSERKRSFLKNGTRGFTCTVCNSYFADPAREERVQPQRDLGPNGWMAN
jgi:hypothetical protein